MLVSSFFEHRANSGTFSIAAIFGSDFIAIGASLLPNQPAVTSLTWLRG
jgi:hypothetical protein